MTGALDFMRPGAVCVPNLNTRWLLNVQEIIDNN